MDNCTKLLNAIKADQTKLPQAGPQIEGRASCEPSGIPLPCLTASNLETDGGEEGKPPYPIRDDL